MSPIRKFALAAILALLCFGLPGMSQVVGQSELVYKNGHFYKNGVKLSKTQLMGVLSFGDYTQYEAAAKQRLSGIYCTPLGGISICCGAIFMADGFKRNTEAESSGEKSSAGPVEIGAGAVVLAGGIACTTLGIICICQGNMAMRAIAMETNFKQLTLSPSKTGLGLAINF